MSFKFGATFGATNCMAAMRPAVRLSFRGCSSRVSGRCAVARSACPRVAGNGDAGAKRAAVPKVDGLTRPPDRPPPSRRRTRFRETQPWSSRAGFGVPQTEAVPLNGIRDRPMREPSWTSSSRTRGRGCWLAMHEAKGSKSRPETADSRLILGPGPMPRVNRRGRRHERLGYPAAHG